jgi:ribonuclease J
LLEEVNRITTSEVQKLLLEEINQWSTYKQSIKESIGRFLFAKTKRRPMILPIIIQI